MFVALHFAQARSMNSDFLFIVVKAQDTEEDRQTWGEIVTQGQTRTERKQHNE